MCEREYFWPRNKIKDIPIHSTKKYLLNEKKMEQSQWEEKMRRFAHFNMKFADHIVFTACHRCSCIIPFPFTLSSIKFILCVCVCVRIWCVFVVLTSLLLLLLLFLYVFRMIIYYTGDSSKEWLSWLSRLQFLFSRERKLVHHSKWTHSIFFFLIKRN